ncbi:type IV toxin-antitoxin system AbiEi family antitoxin [Bifidobacterium felsineum]|uniref:Uncharacterized protein n=1 Tax=Bifidobacterium felsineum TaxID=2045440 RepID=A0A2M9HLY0_9BIFI|nr:hypothetical protein [Bifidobacterium felsineum]PJM77816.1 hypothetical protein CSQ86_01810 [Bifidobacterium felsineum]
MKEHKEVAAALRSAQSDYRCASGTNDALRKAMRRRAAAGDLVSPYRNMYAARDYWNALNNEQQSLHVIRGLAYRHPSWVFTGLSAACLYGVQHSRSLHDGKVYVASTGGIGGADESHLVRVYMNQIPQRMVQGIRLVSPARMILDCAGYPFVHALAIIDSTLRMGLTSCEEIEALSLQSVCDERSVKRLVRYADAGSENGGESLFRGMLIERNYAEPLLQVEFGNPDNPAMPYRVDFCWKLADGRIIVAEYDGMAKYADATNKNRASLQAKLDYERRREQHLKAQKVTAIIHVFFEDLMSPRRFEEKMNEAGVPKIV